MNDLRNDIYTENDVKENIDAGNIYKEPNIKCKLTIIEDYIYHATPDESEFLIDFETMFVECALGNPTTPITEGYMDFKDGSYIKLILNPDWSTGTLPLVTNMRFECYFGIADTEGVITEYLFASATGLPPTKHYWYPEPSPQPHWEMEEIVYQPGDKFRLYLGWWNDASPKLRTIFVPYISGGGQFTLESYNNVMSRNTISSGIQSAVQLTTETGQKIAAYLCGYTTEGTKYPGNDSETGGGNGTFYNRNDEIGLPAIPGLQAIDLGFTTLYNPHEADVRALASWLWTDDFTDNIKMNFADPLNNILGINFIALPEGMINNEAATFVIGNCDSHIQTMRVIAGDGNHNQYVELDCGDINLPEYWQNFLDYNTQFNIWLPYIGFRSLRADDVLQFTEDNGGYLNVTYYIDLLTGCAVCHLICKIEDNATHEMKEHLLYSFNCNCFYSTPISGANYTSMYNQQLSATASGINNLAGSAMKMAKGDMISVVSGAVSLLTGQAQSKREYETAKPDYGRSGNSGGNTGYFSYKKPYVIRTQAIEQTPKNYKSLQGVPSQIYSKLEDLTGYTEIDRVITDTLISCTSEEKEEIIRMLKNGVVL